MSLICETSCQNHEGRRINLQHVAPKPKGAVSSTSHEGTVTWVGSCARFEQINVFMPMPCDAAPAATPGSLHKGNHAGWWVRCSKMVGAVQAAHIPSRGSAVTERKCFTKHIRLWPDPAATLLLLLCMHVHSCQMACQMAAPPCHTVCTCDTWTSQLCKSALQQVTGS